MAKLNEERGSEHITEVFTLSQLKALPDLEEMYYSGLCLCCNLLMHGSSTEKKWRIRNWGTTTNATDIEIDYDSGILSFDTANCAPLNALIKMSVVFKNIVICDDWRGDHDGSRLIVFDGNTYERALTQEEHEDAFSHDEKKNYDNVVPDDTSYPVYKKIERE